MLKVLELFAGVGACSQALTNLGIEHEVVDAVEIDKYAIASFNAIHNTAFAPQDITQWDKDLQVDLIMHGSPCQDFSAAGRRAGGDEASGTRSSLMYETLRIVDKIRPKFVIWENVQNLLSKRHRHNFDAYLVSMQQLGYNSYYQVLNAKDYGVPQNRGRVFTVSIRNDGDFDSYYEFPSPVQLDKKLNDLLEKHVDDKYFLSTRMKQYIVSANSKWSGNNNHSIINKTVASTINTGEGSRRCDASNYVCKTVGPDYDLKTSPLTIADLPIRRLTPRECWRVMGFSDNAFDKAQKINSNTQLYKQAGNSICVPVIEAVLRKLLTYV